MTDEEAADILEAVVVFDDDPAALEPYRRAVAALRGRKVLVDALERIRKRADAQPVHICWVADFDLELIAKEASSALDGAKDNT